MEWKVVLKRLVEAALVVGLLFLFISLYIAYQTHEYIYDSASDVPKTQVALVLGASVSSTGVLSPVLAERANEAIALYNAHKVSKILVTGDNATLTHDEVDPVGKYLLTAGIPKEDIFLDHAGFDTYSSMYRARDVFDVSSVTVVSQSFHLPRAVFIARTLGLKAYGVSAGEGELYVYNYIREIPASVKAVDDLIMTRVPEYLGPRFPISGDGFGTWGGATTTATTTSQ